MTITNIDHEVDHLSRFVEVLALNHNLESALIDFYSELPENQRVLLCSLIQTRLEVHLPTEVYRRMRSYFAKTDGNRIGGVLDTPKLFRPKLVLPTLLFLSSFIVIVFGIGLATSYRCLVGQGFTHHLFNLFPR
jgi:hypothetical protein